MAGVAGFEPNTHVSVDLSTICERFCMLVKNRRLVRSQLGISECPFTWVTNATHEPPPACPLPTGFAMAFNTVKGTDSTWHDESCGFEETMVFNELHAAG